MAKFNNEFQYLLNSTLYDTITSDNYKIVYSEKPDVKINDYFDKLSWDTSKLDRSLKLGHINFLNQNKPIDLINEKNKQTLSEIANLFNFQNKDVNSLNISNINATIINENIYNTMGTIKQETDISSGNLNQKFTEIYDDTYSSYIYRASRVYSDGFFNQNNILCSLKTAESPFIISIFSFDSLNEITDIDIGLKMRNIIVPFKIIQTSEHLNENEQLVHSYIAIAPEYILKNYQSYIHSIMYIEKIKGEILNNKIYYNKLSDNELNKYWPLSSAKKLEKNITIKNKTEIHPILSDSQNIKYL